MVSIVLDKCFLELPVKLDTVLAVASSDPAAFLEKDNTIERLIVTLLNEEDDRIAAFPTKFEVIAILRAIVTSSRHGRLKCRRVLQSLVNTTWGDELVAIEDLSLAWNDDLSLQVKEIFFLAWRTSPSLQEMVMHPSVSLRAALTLVLQYYAATQLSATVRGYLDRLHLRRSLEEAALQQRREIQQWSILLLQKNARGYIARKTIVRSRRIRKQLSKEVLRIAERFLTQPQPDLWGFLGDINDELDRSKLALARQSAREDQWAASFVTQVLAHRQAEFDQSWERFPQALHDLQQTSQGHAKYRPQLGEVGSLLDGHVDTQLVERLGLDRQEKEGRHDGGGTKTMTNRQLSPLAGVASTSAAFASTASSIVLSPAGPIMHNPLTSSSFSSHALPPLGSPSHTVASTTAASLGSPPDKSKTASSSNKQRKSSSSRPGQEITSQEVQQAMAANDLHGTSTLHLPSDPQRLPGPLLRKALQKTVQVEVSSQLNQLMNGNYHSRKLTQAIQEAYAQDSIVDSKEHKKQKQLTQQRTQQPAQGKQLQPAKKKRKKVSLDGKEVIPPGRITANHNDWLSQQEQIQLQGEGGEQEEEDGRKGSSVVQPGHALLLDVPMGLQDSLERLMHAAALRCYVPEFFRGTNIGEEERATEEDGEEEDDGSLQQQQQQQQQQRVRERVRERRLRREREGDNSDPNYAYQLYLKLPLGLAKIKYEQDCKQYSQVYINRLRVKGMNYLPEVLPISKMMVCLKNVETPRPLINKCIDLCLELKAMDKVPLGSTVDGRLQEARQEILQAAAEEKEKQLRQHGSPPPSMVAASSVPPRAASSNSSRHRHGVAGQHSSSSSLSPSPSKASPNKFVSFASSSSGPSSNRGHRRPHEEVQEEEESMEHIHELIETMASKTASMALANQQRSQLDDLKIQAGKILETMVDPTLGGAWCSLEASIDELFLQAAFLVVPHAASPFDRAILTMGNQALRHYLMDLLSLTKEDEQDDFVRARFRSAVILVTPFTLYLKNHGITTIRRLLQVDLHDLQLPSALFLQLEVLLTAVVGTQAPKAKVLPIPRNHVKAINDNDFLVPTLYDTRFQRTPFDPFGRPPVLLPKQQQQRGHGTAAAVAVGKAKVKRLDATAEAARKALLNIDSVDSIVALEADLPRDKPRSIWQQQDQDQPVAGQQQQRTLPSLSSKDIWTRRSLLQLGRRLEDSLLLENDDEEEVEGKGDGAETGDKRQQARQVEKGGRRQKKQNMTTIQKPKEVRLSKTSPSSTNFLQQNLHVRPLDAFKETYVCPHAHCHQVFSRLYTYKVHLKSHERFPNYHLFKREPQVALDEL